MEPTSYEPTASGPVDLESNLARAPEAPDPAGPDRLERAHISLKGAVERLLAESRHGDFIEATHLVRHATHLLQTLDPAALEPRRGLAGLFDGRGARLKRFRAQYLPAAASAGDTAAALAERGVKTSEVSVWRQLREAGYSFKKNRVRQRAGSAGGGETPHPLEATTGKP